MSTHSYIYTEIESIWGCIHHSVCGSPLWLSICIHQPGSWCVGTGCLLWCQTTSHLQDWGHSFLLLLGMLAGNGDPINHSIVITFKQIEKPGHRLAAISPRTHVGNKLWGLLSPDGASPHPAHQPQTTLKNICGLCWNSLLCFHLPLPRCWSCDGQNKKTQRQSTWVGCSLS